MINNVQKEDNLVTVEHVSKKFCKNLKKSLWYGVKDITTELVGGNSGHDLLRKDEFWAVKDVSLKLKRGECLGLIGHNGAGKSTLLKMLNGLIKPDKGKITMRGRIGALIELGAGFNPLLTGRENIYINGQVLGFSKKEIDQKFDYIVDFAELEDFIDTPVQNYSSGMKVRLGFAVASQMEPDVLLIDEVLAVGDVGFRSKCFNAINVISQKAAVIFVSHAMPQIARIASKGLLMYKGTDKYYGNNIPTLIDKYYSTFGSEKGAVSGSLKAKIIDVKFSNSNDHGKEDEIFKVKYLDKLIIDVKFQADKSINALNINLAFYDKELRAAAQTYSINSDLRIKNDCDFILTKTTIPQLNLNPGVYTLSIIITDENRGETLINHHAFKDFQVYGDFIGFTPVQYRAQWERIN